jgi:hypothetical protein
MQAVENPREGGGGLKLLLNFGGVQSFFQQNLKGVNHFGLLLHFS